MPDIFLLKAIAKTLILPPTGLLLAILFGLFLVQRFPRTGRAISIIATVYLLALSTPLASYQLMHFLETSPPLDLNEARQAQAIVILGGGVRTNALEYGGDSVGRLTLDRVRYGARIAKQTGLPVLVAGGSVLGDGDTEAKLMRETLENEFGVKVRWSEDKSRNTHENAGFSAAMLAKENIQKVVLVTHSFDMPRAKAEFTASGLQVTAAPTGILNGNLQWPSDYLPGMGGLQASYYVCYELLAMIVMRISLHQ